VSVKLDRLATLFRTHTSDQLRSFWTDIMGRKKPPAPPTLSQVLRQTILDRHITAYALAKHSGVSVTAIQRFLNGERSVNLKNAQKLCEALGLTLVPIDPPAE
jgi:hypothetical protein